MLKLTPTLQALMLSGLVAISWPAWAEENASSVSANQVDEGDSSTSDTRTSGVDGDTFKAILGQARAHDPDLRAEQMRYKGEQEETNIALSALLPQVNVQGRFSRQDSDNIYTDQDSQYYDPDKPRSSGKLNETYYQASIQQTLFDWAKFKDLDRADAYVAAAEARLKGAEQELTYRAAQAYLKVLFQSQQVYLNNNKLESLQLKLAQAQRQNQLGVGDQLNLLEVQARRDLARADLLQAKSDLSDAKTELRKITGQDVQVPERWVKAGYLIEPQRVDSNLDEWLNMAKQGFEYRQAQQMVREAKEQASVQWAGHYPTLSLSLSYSDRHSEDDLNERTDKTAALQLALPIYQGGRTQAQTRRAEAQMQAQMAKSDKALADARQKIRLSFSRLGSLGERLEALRQSRQSSERYLIAAERGLKLNLRSQVEVLDARTQLVDTQLKFAEALNNYLTADLDLHYQTGDLTANHVGYYDQLFQDAAAKLKHAVSAENPDISI